MMWHNDYEIGVTPGTPHSTPEAIFKIRQELNPPHELSDKKSGRMYRIQYVSRNKPRIQFSPQSSANKIINK